MDPNYLKLKLLQEKPKHWNLFYKRNSNHFYKDRHWTDREFPELLNRNISLLEIGCGHGSFLFPLLTINPDIFIYCCDFAPSAIELVMQHPEYNPERVHAFVCDITSQDLNLTISEPCIDVISSIFCFSALQPCTMKMAAENLYKVLKPGGLILFRDYAVGDLAMKRFKQESKIEENLYHRQDGTLSYFFSKEMLSEIFISVGFEIQDAEYVRKTVVNRKQELEMERVFIQARIRKP